jgi:hypothetical protein
MPVRVRVCKMLNGLFMHKFEPKVTNVWFNNFIYVKFLMRRTDRQTYSFDNDGTALRTVRIDSSCNKVQGTYRTSVPRLFVRREHDVFTITHYMLSVVNNV